MTIAKVGRRGQIVIPKKIRERLGIKEGHRIAFVLKNGQVGIEPLTTTIFDLRGSVPVDGPQDFNEVRRKAREIQARKIASEGRPNGS